MTQILLVLHPLQIEATIKHYCHDTAQNQAPTTRLTYRTLLADVSRMAMSLVACG